jgi:hypothetical protein
LIDHNFINYDRFDECKAHVANRFKSLKKANKGNELFKKQTEYKILLLKSNENSLPQDEIFLKQMKREGAIIENLTSLTFLFGGKKKPGLCHNIALLNEH